ncbi:MAG: tetratricopeptide repeat protein [Terriglobia bacterium]
MRKDTAWVAAICLVLGGLIGYLLGVQITSQELRHTPSAPPVSQTAANVPASPSGAFPEGHPPLVTQSDIEVLKKAVESAPQNAAMITDLANKLYDAGRFQEAANYYQQAVQLDPNNVNVITDYGTALFYSGRPDDAITQYNRSLQIDPRHTQSLHNLVIVYLQGKKDLEGAGTALNRLKSTEPGNPSIPELERMIQSGVSSGPAPPSGNNPRQRIF